VANKHQMTGMLGVYLVAAELSKQGFIVSTTSRSAAGADLLVTDQKCKKAWTVQVKTNRERPNFWLVGAHTHETISDSHVYVFVNVGNTQRPEFIVASSRHVAEKVLHEVSPAGSEWYSFKRSDRQFESEGWEEVFGGPQGPAAADELDEIPN
jgi:hypothetical protein